MTGKTKLMIGLGVGYVLGTRAGRERYDQMIEKAQSMWRDPKTQQKMHQARDMAQEKMGQAAHTVQDTVRHAGSGAHSDGQAGM